MNLMDGSTTTRALLTCGVIGGPLFSAVVVIQELTREGFDPRQHALVWTWASVIALRVLRQRQHPG